MDSARQADPRPRATLTVPTAPPAAAGLRRAGCSGQRRHSVRPLRAQGADGSFDEGGLDYKLAKELDTASWSVRKAAVTKHLELLYQASQSQSERNKVERCEPCGGTGECECGWCHGTGAMTIGDVLYCSEGGCAPCPVCRGTGACKCEHCRGTGRRASWLPLAP